MRGGTHVILLVILAVGAVNVARGGKLYPRCGGDAVQATVKWNGTESVLLQTASVTPTSHFEVVCLGFDVEPADMLRTDCFLPYSDTTPFAVILRAEGTVASTNTPFVIDYELDDVVGGSADRLHFSLPATATWSLRFRNEHPSKCDVRVTAVLNFVVGTTSSTRSDPVPALVFLNPTTLYEGKAALFTVFAPNWVLGTSDAPRIVRFGQDCSATSLPDGTPAIVPAQVTDQDLLARHNLQHLSPGHYVYSHTFAQPGNYRLCFRRGATAVFERIAELVVFASNPMFFTVEAGAGAGGIVFLNTPTTVKFHGLNLDSNPAVTSGSVTTGGDRVKFVDVTEMCDVGTPAGGPPMGTNLGPGDATGLSFTTWEFTLTVAGSFRLCYSRGGTPFAEIVNFDDLPPVGVPAMPESAHPAPIATDSTGVACPTAAPRPNRPTVPTVLKLTVGRTNLPLSFSSSLATLLCVPANTLYVLSMSHAGTQGTTDVYIDVVCDKFGLHEGCDGNERKDYLLYLFYSSDARLGQLQIIGIKEVVEEGITAIGDAPLTQSNPMVSNAGTALVVVVVFGLLGVVMMIVAGVSHWNRQRHHFVQVGVSYDDEAGPAASEIPAVTPAPAAASSVAPRRPSDKTSLAENAA